MAATNIIFLANLRRSPWQVRARVTRLTEELGQKKKNAFPMRGAGDAHLAHVGSVWNWLGSSLSYGRHCFFTACTSILPCLL